MERFLKMVCILQTPDRPPPRHPPSPYYPLCISNFISIIHVNSFLCSFVCYSSLSVVILVSFNCMLFLFLVLFAVAVLVLLLCCSPSMVGCCVAFLLSFVIAQLCTVLCGLIEAILSTLLLVIN
jgi:hypothetical protein